MDDRSVFWLAALLAPALAWLTWRRRAERRRLPAMLEELSGRAVLQLSRHGRLLAMGPRARQVLGLDGRADPVTIDSLPLEGLTEHLRQASMAGAAPSRPTGPILLHAPSAAPRPVRVSPLCDLSGDTWLAFEPEAARAAPAMPPEALEPMGVLAGVRILLADDGPDNQLLLGYFLQGEGAELVIVDDGADAISRVRAQTFDVVLLDMQMPGVNGYQAAGYLRALHPDLPVVALTAHTGSGVEERCRAAGCTHYLAKPVRKEALLELVRAIADERRSKAAASGDAEIYADSAFQTMIAEFVGALGERLSEMHRALDSGDWERLETLAHRLKGAAGGFGLPAISEASSRVESEASRHADPETARSALVELRQIVRGAAGA
jgi:CheY-like chemotaxis protein